MNQTSGTPDPGTNQHVENRHPASYRDPAGYVFIRNNTVYRRVKAAYRPNYDHLMESGLYQQLVNRGWLVAHEETEREASGNLTIAPAWISPFNYPYEWTFDMLKDAGKLTLQIMQLAMQHGMILKDATAFNITFKAGKPVFIDSLSFELYDNRQPWIAYRQFCQQFLYPLLLAHYKKGSFQSHFILNDEGMDVAAVAALLPVRSWFSAAVWMHVWLPFWVSRQKQRPPKPSANPSMRFDQEKMRRLIAHLRAGLDGLRLPEKATAWNNYYSSTILGPAYLAEKLSAIGRLIERLSPGDALDLGANDGVFAELLAARGWRVTAFDLDEMAINALYKKTKKNGYGYLQPLQMNLVQASPAIGWLNAERPGFWERFSGDLVLVLALVHHLYFRENLPFAQISLGMAMLSRQYMIIEFVLPTDEKVQQMVAGRSSLLEEYDEMPFIAAMQAHFIVVERVPLKTASRLLYLMKKKAE